jgi:hypothetical protein
LEKKPLEATMAKKKLEKPKQRNMVALAMRLRYANGRGAGGHGQKGYKRHAKHKGRGYP